jgi:copper chaperone CopZ
VVKLQCIFEIPDMHCTNCARKISLTLGFLSGIDSSEVNFQQKKAIVEINPAKISQNKIKLIIIALGFSALLI